MRQGPGAGWAAAQPCLGGSAWGWRREEGGQHSSVPTSAKPPTPSLGTPSPWKRRPFRGTLRPGASGQHPTPRPHSRLDPLLELMLQGCPGFPEEKAGTPETLSTSSSSGSGVGTSSPPIPGGRWVFDKTPNTEPSLTRPCWRACHASPEVARPLHVERLALSGHTGPLHSPVRKGVQ